MSYWAACAYYPAREIQSWSCHYCQRFKLQEVSVHVSLDYDNQAYVGYSREEDSIIVGFRGTIDLINWLDDFEIALVDYPHCKDCKVHQGFSVAYRGLQGFVGKSLANLTSRYPGAAIYVTGHSLGAALALIGGLDISRNYSQVRAIYTLGQPRAGNTYFAQYA
jgi:predicted lipase